MTPQQGGKRHGFEPSGVHRLNLFGRMPFFRQEALDGERDGENERHEVAEMNDGNGFHTVGLVLFGAVVAQGDFVLVIEPVLVVGATAEVENPLTETLAYRTEVIHVGLPVVGKVMHQMGVPAHIAVPEVEDFVGLVSQNLPSEAEALNVFVSEKYGFFQKVEVGNAYW